MLHSYKYPIIISPKLHIYNGTFGFMGFHASNKEITIESDYFAGTSVDLSFYFDKYKEYNKEKIEAEIKKINTLFEILENKSKI